MQTPPPDFSRPAPLLALVVPCLDEAEALPETQRVLMHTLDSLVSAGLAREGSFVLYVDDGSSDSTWRLIEEFAGVWPGRVRGLRLAANAGHQHALMAGLDEVAGVCDAAVSLDADLQDSPEAIADMLRLYAKGYEIVYGVRRRRKSDNVFKVLTAKAFYRLRRSLGVSTVCDHADFRLLSAKALKALGRFEETNLFLRGIVPMLGMTQGRVYYDRPPRRHGKSKYPLARMLNFAADGITSFSVRPARMILGCGLAFMAIAAVILVYVLIRYFTDHTIAGWTSIILSIWFCTGVLLLALGVVGEYLAKVYMEVKRRPRWQPDSRTGTAVAPERDENADSGR